MISLFEISKLKARIKLDDFSKVYLKEIYFLIARVISEFN
jgi:hypothetical protein